MRSKEVEEAIKVMQRDMTDYKEELEIELEDRTDEQHISYLIQQTTSYETVLAYIEELEKKLECIKNVTPSGYINGKYLEEIAKRYINKNKIKNIIDTYYPDVAIVKLNGLLEEEE